MTDVPPTYEAINCERKPQEERPPPPPSVVLIDQSHQVCILGRSPQLVTCTKCHAEMVTQVAHQNGLLTWLLCSSLCLIGCDLGCCLSELLLFLFFQSFKII